ncbi:MAG: exodeoxyribonuclease VII large subunit [Candidatus Onthomorpha sp.]
MPDEPQQPIYTPTDILNIVKEHLRTSNIPVVIEGVYQMVGTKAYNGGIWWYDEIRSQFDNSKLKAMVPTSIRDQVKAGDVVQLSGTITKTVNDYDGKIELMLRVSGLLGKRGNEISEEELERLKLLQQKASKGSKPVDSLLESLLFSEERQPKIALVYAESSITDADFRAGVQSASGSIDFKEFRQSFNDVQGFSQLMGELDNGGYDILCIIRGGGVGLDVFENPKMATVMLGLTTPTIAAIGHEVDTPLLCKVSDRNIGTPSLLGQYFKDMVENVSEKKTKSRASLTEKIKKQFQEQLEAGQKQNKELQEKLATLTKNQEEATKKHNEQVVTAQKQNQELQKKLNDLTEIQKKHTDEMGKLQNQLKEQTDNNAKQAKEFGERLGKMQETNGQLQKNLDKITTENTKSLKLLGDAKERAKDLERQLSESKNTSGWKIGVVILSVISLVLLILYLVK